MIKRVRLVRFKRFIDETFDLTGNPVLLAGPNNSGKTTLLHALASWNLATTRWLAERGDSGGKRRIGVALDEFTSLPLREMNLLWLNRHTAVRPPGQKQPKAAPIYIEVVAGQGARVEESLTIEFLYAHEKLVYVRPVRGPSVPEQVDTIPAFVKDLQIIHIPAFSGIATQEPRHASGIQNKLVGEGRPGEIVRNLLLEIWEGSKRRTTASPWADLHSDVERLFECDLLPPDFSGVKPYIVCEYRPRLNRSDASSRPPKLDVANAGSGFHQVLLLLSFFYARQAAVFLLDEPDAHLHFILQREIFDHLRTVAQRRGCQLIIGTHAEVLLSETEPDQIISFVGQQPRRLATAADKQRVQDALRNLTALDLLNADHVGAVMYVEDESDYKLLREWSVVLKHAAEDFLRFPFVVPLRGKGNVNRAKQHFQCLRLAKPQIKGICIVDRDFDVVTGSPQMPAGLDYSPWKRYEVENYLLIPSAIKRYLRGADEQMALGESAIDLVFAENFPPGIDFLRDIPALSDLKASDFVEHLLGQTPKPLPKRDLYMLAQYMRAEEIHPDVVKMLDRIATILPATVPSVEANTAPPDRNGVEEAR
jgi:predicted ATPase